MPGVVPLRKIQIGTEGTAGTAVAATTIWRGEGTGEDTTEFTFPPEQVGFFGGTDRQYVAKYGGTITTTSDATFEQLGYILNASIHNATGASDGGSGFIYSYVYPKDADATPQTYTIEAGDNIAAEEMAYCYVPSFSLSGNAGEAMQLSADWEGRQWTPTTFTGALSLPTVETILASKGKLYIDSASDTIGTTLKSGTLLGFTLNVNGGLMPYFTTDGNLYFTGIKRGDPDITLELVFEHDATSVAQKADWRAGVAKQIRLKFEGSALASAGTYTYKTLIIDAVGRFESFSGLGNQDGNNTITATLRVKYDEVAQKTLNFFLVNELSVLP